MTLPCIKYQHTRSFDRQDVHVLAERNRARDHAGWANPVQQIQCAWHVMGGVDAEPPFTRAVSSQIDELCLLRCM